MVKVKVKDTEVGTIKTSGDFILGVVASRDGEDTLEGDVLIAGKASPIALADALARLIVNTTESITENKGQASSFLGVLEAITTIRLEERGYDGYRSSEEGEEEVSGA